MAKAIILSRVSTTEQSLDSQTQAIMNEARKEGFKDIDLIIIEEKESAIKLSEEERKGLSRMKECISSDKTITHVFIYELSRLSRRQLVLFSIRDYLIERNIQLVCCTPYFRMLEDGKLSQTANLMFSIFASMAESEMTLKQERMMRGKLYNKAHGKNSGHTLLYGYGSKDDHTIYVDQEKARDIIEIFEEYATGKFSLDTLAAHLKKKHTIEKHALYERGRLAFILKNKAYCGNTEYPQIISKDLFETCEHIRKKNNTTSKKTKESTALCKRILFDERGNHMTFIMYKDERYVSVKTTSPTVKKEAVDEPVWMLAKILHKNYMDNRDAIRKQLNKEIAELEKERDVALKNKKRLAISIDTIEERLILGKVSKGKAEQLEAKVNEDIMAIDKQLRDIEDKIKAKRSMVEQTYEESGIDYEAMAYEEKVKLIRQVIEKVVVTKPSKRKADLRVVPKVSKVEYILHVDIYSGDVEMTSRGLLDLAK